MNKVEKHLSPEELRAFLEECMETPGLTLEKIQELAAGRGLEISLMAAKSFRDKNFDAHIRRLRKAKELAESLEGFKDSGGTITDASAALLAQEVFDAISTGRVEDINTMSKVVARLRQGDVRAKQLEMKVAEFEEAKRRVAQTLEKAKAKKGGISEETLREIEERLGLL